MTAQMTDLVARNSDILIGLAGFVCGVCLMYLVMWRTMKRRELS